MVAARRERYGVCAMEKRISNQHRARARLERTLPAYRWLFDLMGNIYPFSHSEWQACIYVPVSALSPKIPEALKNLGGERAIRDLYSQGAERIAFMISAAMTFGTWRVTQGIYRFDEEIYKSLVDTSLSGEIPAEVLTRLPEWCVYVETPGLFLSDKLPLHGVWARLDLDQNNRTLLAITPDADEGDFLIPPTQHIELGTGSVEDSLSAAWKSWIAAGAQSGGHSEQEIVSGISRWLSPVVNLLLYLCSENDFMRKGQEDLPANPSLRKTKKGVRLFPADGPTTWDVGVRMGAALRAAREAGYRAGEGEGKSSTRPHVRRAHWHTYLTGPRADPRRELRWLPPIPVGIKDLDELVATIRKVQ